MQLFGDLDILSFVRLGRLNWIGDFNRMESKRKVSPFLNNHPQRTSTEGTTKNRWWKFDKHTNKCKIKNW